MRLTPIPIKGGSSLTAGLLPLLLAVTYAKQTEKTPLAGAISLWVYRSSQPPAYARTEFSASANECRV